MSSISGSTTETKCSKCQKETADNAECTACQEKQTEKVEKAVEKTGNWLKMEMDRDLTTTETLEDEDLEEEQEEKLIVLKKQSQTLAISLSPQKEQQQQQQQMRECRVKLTEHPVCATDEPAVRETSPVTIKTEVDSKPTKMAASSHTPTARGGGKVTRSSLNGARSPQIMKRLRKSTRSTRFKSKLTARGGANNGGAGGAANVNNGAGGGINVTASTSAAAGKSHGKLAAHSSPGGARNRRTLFKRPAQKTPRVQATTRFVKSVFYKGSYMQIGDIVSIVDSEQCVYYAQVRGLLVDAYCEKSAFLTWLIPTQDSPDPMDGFDPATYLIGPDEELSRKLCYLEFIMHAPSNYYFDRTTPYPLPDADEYAPQRTGGYIWTRLPIFKRDREREREKIGKAAA